MARRPRVFAAGLLYHVILGCNQLHPGWGSIFSRRISVSLLRFFAVVPTTFLAASRYRARYLHIRPLPTPLNLKLHSTIQCVPGVVGSGADNVFAESFSRRFDSPRQLSGLRF